MSKEKAIQIIEEVCQTYIDAYQTNGEDFAVSSYTAVEISEALNVIKESLIK